MRGRNSLRETHKDLEESFSKRHPRLHTPPAVFVGGVMGTAIRAALSGMQSSNWTWPWVTFCINMVGSTLLGFLLEYLAGTGNDVGARQSFRLFVGTGIIGGFTTYGTFILEADTRLLGAHLLLGLSYAAVSIVLGLVFAGCGVRLASLCIHQGSRKVGNSR
ncbi:MAG: CrcB family protein [Bifidobacterium aquikefiri]|uniref:fluoride efflux transporter FluC n=1 Tax=Bifidobacterium aquikefiri TaxID=1653207 RepID=UPI0039ED7B1F